MGFLNRHRDSLRFWNSGIRVSSVLLIGDPSVALFARSFLFCFGEYRVVALQHSLVCCCYRTRIWFLFPSASSSTLWWESVAGRLSYLECVLYRWRVPASGLMFLCFPASLSSLIPEDPYFIFFFLTVSNPLLHVCAGRESASHSFHWDKDLVEPLARFNLWFNLL